MNNEKANKLLLQFAACHFYDQIGEFSADEIIADLLEQIKESTHKNQLLYWEQMREALLVVSKNYTNRDVDKLLDKEFGILSNNIDDGKLLMLRISNEFGETLNRVRLNLSD